MRGVLSFLYAFAAVTSILFLYSYYASFHESVSRSESTLLLLEDRHAREMELKRAITDTIAHSAQEAIVLNPSASQEEIRDAIGEGLAGLKQLESDGSYNYYRIRRLETKFWCGNPSDNDLKAAIKTAAWFNHSEICNGCYPIDDIVPVYDPVSKEVKLKRRCALYVSVNTMERTAKISATRVNITNETTVASGEPMFGVMVYDSIDNISSAAIVPFSTKIRWG